MWYFGDHAALNFNSGSPVALTNSAMLTSDNTASIAEEKTGILLFYSNGQNVWNRNHTVMPNGSGLLGDETGGNSAFPVKVPGSDTLYYLFTNDAVAGPDGLRYSIIDMSLDNGNGNVTSIKNISLLNPSTEKITAIKHSNNIDVWVITHQWNSNSFNVYLLTNAGLNTTPVISSVGSVHTGGTNGTYNAVGQISASLDGDKIVCAIMELNKYELFDFDRTTGILSNPIVIAGYPNAWGAEFSADGTKLYTTRWSYASIFQFDLSSNNQTTICNSVVTVGQSSGVHPLYKCLYIKRGSDDRIYIPVWNSTYIGYIEYPNVSGVSCNYVENGVYLAGVNRQHNVYQ